MVLLGTNILIYTYIAGTYIIQVVLLANTQLTFHFTLGVYQSLQHGCLIDGQDVDAAINEICEESLPIEIDITQFLQCCCGHVRHIMEKANLERMFREDLSKTQPKVMSKQSEDESEEDPLSKEVLSRY